MAVIDRWSGRSETVPYGVFDDLGVFVGRAYMPADHVTASSPVRSVGPLPYRKAAGSLESRPYMGISECSAVPVGAVHRAALTAVSRIPDIRAARCTAPTGDDRSSAAVYSDGSGAVFPRLPP